MNKAVYYFLPALWGYLDNSYLWLCLNIDRDCDVPHLPENMFDKSLIMQYFSRIEYLLRLAMLANLIVKMCALFLKCIWVLTIRPQLNIV